MEESDNGSNSSETDNADEYEECLIMEPLTSLFQPTAINETM